MRTLAILAASLAVAFAAQAQAQSARDCKDCPKPRPHYDSQEVRKNTRTIDHSRTIETRTVVPVKRRTVTRNHLVIHKNTTRHVGTVRHRHTIVEREIRYVRPRAPTVVNFVVHDYRIVRRRWTDPDPRPIYVAPIPECVYGKDGRCSGVPLDVRG
jgi:hypothetical protein